MPPRNSGKRQRERVLAAFDEIRRAVGMLRALKKKEGTYRGGEGMTPVVTACPEDRWG